MNIFTDILTKFSRDT